LRFFIQSIAFLILFIFITNCHKSPKCWGEKEKNSGIIVRSFNPSDNCNVIVNPDSSYVINSLNEYQQLSTLAHSNLTTCKFNEINFNNYTLLGKTIFATCKFKLSRNVEKNELQKKYIYTIELFQCGNCVEQNKKDNWVLVPKIPSGYDVDFIFIKK
jgi:hypothetical protein